MDFGIISGIVVSLLFAVFFSGIEVAFLSANKLQIELLGKQGNISGQIMTFFTKRTTWFIGTTLIGNIAALLLFGIFSTQLLMPVLRNAFDGFAATVFVPLIALTFLFTIVILYLLEFLSKGFFIIHSNRLVSALAIPFIIIWGILFPVVFGIISLARFLSVSVLKLEYSKEKPVFGLTDVNEYLKSIHRVRQEDENIELDRKIFTNALEFKSVRVWDCMIPRTEITAVSLDAGIKKLHEAFLESGHSKIIIFKESIDDVIGYCHSAALFKNPERIEEILTPIITVPESMLARDLLVKFINDRKSLAVVVDEFGGTSGMVSMEDVIEEIFGEIEDEHDQDDQIDYKVDDHTYMLSARLEINYLNETYGWKLPEGDYETLSGLILSLTEDIPEEGTAVTTGAYTFVIQATADNRIETVKLLIDKSKLND
jgi:putative hemolysin